MGETQGADQAPYEIIRKGEGVYDPDGTVILEDVSDRLEIDLQKKTRIQRSAASYSQGSNASRSRGLDRAWRLALHGAARGRFPIVRLKAEKIAPPEGGSRRSSGGKT